MQKRVIAILCLAGLAACAPQVGNYAKMSASYNAQMADDGAHKLSVLYPPAATHLAIAQTIRDAYGAELVRKLRESGYAIEDSAAFTPAHNPASAARAVANRSLAYVVDQAGDNLYRVTLRIDASTLSRLYLVSDNAIDPAGAWTRRE